MRLVQVKEIIIISIEYIIPGTCTANGTRFDMQAPGGIRMYEIKWGRYNLIIF